MHGIKTAGCARINGEYLYYNTKGSIHANAVAEKGNGRGMKKV
jgi:hypothetical protein